MLVKSHDEKWFRKPVDNYMKQKGKDYSYETDKVLFGEVYKYLNKLSEDDRDDEINALRRLVDIARQISKKEEVRDNLDKKDNKYYSK